jgi:hypothetical protein
MIDQTSKAVVPSTHARIHELALSIQAENARIAKEAASAGLRLPDDTELANSLSELVALTIPVSAEGAPTHPS